MWRDSAKNLEQQQFTCNNQLYIFFRFKNTYTPTNPDTHSSFSLQLFKIPITTNKFVEKRTLQISINVSANQIRWTDAKNLSKIPK